MSFYFIIFLLVKHAHTEVLALLLTHRYKLEKRLNSSTDNRMALCIFPSGFHHFMGKALKRRQSKQNLLLYGISREAVCSVVCGEACCKDLHCC